MIQTYNKQSSGMMTHDSAGLALQAIEHAIATSGQANKRALARKHLIEKRKEEQERLLLEQEREQEEQRMIQLRISEEAEEKRRKADM